MARLVTYQTSFADGQISPKLEGFVDTDAYRSSVKDLKNMVVMPQGSITRRPGTRYVGETSGHCSVRLIPFNFGQDQAYVLEFGEETFTGATSGATTNKLVYATGGFTTRQHSLVGATVTNTTDSTTAYVKAVDSNTQLSLQDASGSDVDIFTSGENFSIAHKYVRFYKTNAQLLSGGNPYAVASPYSSSDLADLSFTQSADILFIAHPSYQPRQLIRSGDTNWAFEYVHTKDGPYGDINPFGSATIQVVGTETSEEVGDPLLDLSDHFFQFANHELLDGMRVRMALASSGTMPTYHLTSTTDSSTTSFSNSVDYFVVNATATTFQLSTSLNGRPVYLRASTDTVTISKRVFPKGVAVTLQVGDGTSSTWATSTSYAKGAIVKESGGTVYYTCIVAHTSAANKNPTGTLGADYWDKLQINNGLGFQSYDQDTYFRINPLKGTAINWGYVQLDSITNALEVTATVKEELVARGPNHEWRKYAWNSNAGWPRTIEIFQQRMCFGGNNDNPQTIWFSKTADFFNFSPSEKIGVASGNVSATGARVVGEQIKDDNGLTLTISSATVDLIDFMISGKKLTVGTSGGVFQMYGSETEITITPFNFSIDRVTSYPTETGALPLIIDQNVIYVQKNGRKLRAIAYSQDAGGNQASDMTLRADDIALGEIKDITYQDMPYNVIWARLNDGKMIACTYNQALSMMAWSNHEIAGTNAVVESITVIPTSTHHQLWMVVKRTVNSATVRYVEYMDRFYDSGEITSDEAHYVDSGIYTQGSDITNLTGLNHLEGESLRVLADSALQTGTFTVSSGAITINEADKIHAGLGFDSFVTTLDIPNGPQGILVGNRKKISRIVVKLLDTMGLKYGPNTGELDEMIYRFPTDNLGNAVPFFSGDEVLTMGNMTYDDHNVVIGQNGPFPLSILLIGFDYESNDL